MKHRLLPILMLPFCLAIIASRARSAADFPPPWPFLCES